MNTTLTFCDFLDLLILPYTKYKNVKVMNQLFYGSIFATQINGPMASRYKKRGIGGKSTVYADYIESSLDLKTRAKYIEGLNLSGLPEDTTKLLAMLEDFELPQSMIPLILCDENIYIALARILYYVITKPSYAPDLFEMNNKTDTEATNEPDITTLEDFFTNLFSETIADICVDMAFHGEINSFQERDMPEQLNKLIQKGFKVRVIVTTGDLIDNISMHLAQPGREYTSYEQSHPYWYKKLVKSNPLIEVRQTNTPLLHRTYLAYSPSVEGFQRAFAAYYTYGSHDPYNEITHYYKNGDDQFQVLKNEFDYLWNSCCSNNACDAVESFKGNNMPQNILHSSSSHLENHFQDICTKAANGDANAMLELGVYYYYGIAEYKDDLKASIWLKKSIEAKAQNSYIAEKLLGNLYYAGAVPREDQSYKKSYECHVHCAEEDFYSAGMVAFMKSIGLGCDFDYQETEAYYLSILNKLDSPRKATLCKFYMKFGEFQKAAEIFKQIADTFPAAAYQLGLMYKSGVLSTPYKPDYYKAFLYFKMAFDNGYSAAAFELGDLYFRPTGDFKQNFEKAQKFFTIAANNNEIEAQYMLGYMYKYGHVKKDISRAIELFEKAAAQGHVLSSAQLAILYQYEDFLNYDKAFRYCKYGADSGDVPSEFMLGLMYLKGCGCTVNTDKAYLCFKHASENGAPEALIMLNYMNELGI